MPEHPLTGFPLFPLGIVALPTETVPLHIFEDRYRVMIERCLSAESGTLDRQFGVVWLSEQELKPIGCACEVGSVLERMDDGRLNILAEGTRPFRLLEREDQHPYPAGIVEFLSDAEEEADPGAAGAARALYGELVTQATDHSPDERELEALTAYRMAATVDFDPEPKQQLLELRSENQRLRLLTELLRAALERLELLERAETRARSNGKVRFG